MTGLAVTDVDQTSEAFEGLRMGDIITEAGQEQVSSIADLEARIEAAKEAGRRSLLLLVRGGDPRGTLTGRVTLHQGLGEAPTGRPFLLRVQPP